ncbi:threonine aldolase family protein [Frigoriflavimonas asaccharolytica]|uniref:Threonine aldolase n=1 Tax=Frigoriflavimonas asaccharolytica TaxID=2735899 RepID=A0A8J8K4D4_9FLAO|nr:aminotransferase class I/II-fold pyridoxal phosphate-dependent enzyme [Frigoriflavimonas asaccharolytica]NRS91575.1 threonine aldolase [Frigoriflavimonas asaccharolytica]
MKYSFKNDYSEGCHPNILKALLETNEHQQNGYGLDDYSIEAQNLIKKNIKNYDAKVYFVSGGTQANIIVISAFLRPHECVISADLGHILNNETAAIEATGHKIISIPTEDGKINPKQIQDIIDTHQNKPHQVKPKLVYISNSTEIGTTYSKNELQILSDFCMENELYLFMDGARLGNAIMAENTDLSLEDIAKYTDAFYLGGTKNGALLGEAIIINNKNLQPEFDFHIKQKGALLAKGRLLGIQFLELMKDNLYFQLAKKANNHAMKIKEAFANKGIFFYTENFTNQLFPILNLAQIESLAENFDFYVWKKIDEQNSVIRIITSWQTQDIAVEQLTNKIQEF